MNKRTQATGQFLGPSPYIAYNIYDIKKLLLHNVILYTTQATVDHIPTIHQLLLITEMLCIIPYLNKTFIQSSNSQESHGSQDISNRKGLFKLYEGSQRINIHFGSEASFVIQALAYSDLITYIHTITIIHKKAKHQHHTFSDSSCHFWR